MLNGYKGYSLCKEKAAPCVDHRKTGITVEGVKAATPSPKSEGRQAMLAHPTLTLVASMGTQSIQWDKVARGRLYT